MAELYKWDLQFIVQATGGSVVSSPVQKFKNYSVDNRDSNIAESLFIPLVGDKHDAHKYVVAAVEEGATGVLFHKWQEEWEPLKAEASFIKVDNTLEALQSLATAWRETFDAKVLGMTGSNGKTTTKDFLRQILSPVGKTFASQGSFNNHWGVPFTLLNTDQDADFCVTEMGMNHSGEITELCRIAQPDIVAVTNVGRAHIGNFENGIDGIAQAKREIYEAAPKGARLIFNIDNEWTRKMYNDFAERASFTFSSQNFSADVYLKIKNKLKDGFEIEGQIGGVINKARVPFWGEHNLENLCAAVAMAYVAGVSPDKLWTSLSSCHTGWGRNQQVSLKSGGLAIFDGYNANPDSFEQLLKNVTETWCENTKTIAVFGEMLELGESTESEHFALGAKAASLPWEMCLFIGPSATAFRAGWVSVKNEESLKISDTYKESLDIDLHSMLDKDTLVIVKGSRGGALERVVERLEPVNFTSKK